MILNPGTLIVPTKWNTTKRLKLCIVLGYDNGYYVSRALRSSLQKDFLDFFYCEINNYEEIPDSKITFRSFTEEKFVTAVRENYMVDYPANQFHPGRFNERLIHTLTVDPFMDTEVVQELIEKSYKPCGGQTMEILAFTFWTAFLVLNMIDLTLNFNHFRTERVYHSDKIAYLVMVFLDAVLIITSVVILTFQLSNMT